MTIDENETRSVLIRDAVGLPLSLQVARFRLDILREHLKAMELLLRDPEKTELVGQSFRGSFVVLVFSVVEDILSGLCADVAIIAQTPLAPADLRGSLLEQQTGLHVRWLNPTVDAISAVTSCLRPGGASPAGWIGRSLDGSAHA